MSNWLQIIEVGAKVGLGVLMLAQAMEGSNPVANLLSGSLCATRISWIIASRIVRDV